MLQYNKKDGSPYICTLEDQCIICYLFQASYCYFMTSLEFATVLSFTVVWQLQMWSEGSEELPIVSYLP